MKTSVTGLFAIILLTSTQCVSQNRFTVESQNSDISNNLDLKAVASIFGEAKDLQDFEMRLNDYDSQISNLDLNNDGEVDYLRVIETSENNVHLVVIQAVLAKDVFQDIASIVVERNSNRTYVQVIGDSFMYGENYIVEPVYVYTPSIFSFFWGDFYIPWNSPYYWGYYPRYYHIRHPNSVNIYMSNIYLQINHNHKFYYSDRRRNDLSVRLHNSIGRNDYGVRYPERTFIRRNTKVTNRQGFESQRNSNRNSLQSRPTNQVNTSVNRTNRSNDNTKNLRNGGSVNGTRTPTPTINSQPNSNYRNSDLNRGQSERNQTPNNNLNNTNRITNPAIRDNSTRPTTPVIQQKQNKNNNGNRSSNPAVRENNTRSTPTVNQPTRSAEPRQVEPKATENPRNRESKPDKDNQSKETNSNRR